LQQSIAMVNAAGADRWSDEETPYAGADSEMANLAVAAALSMEQSVRQSDRDWLILRGGLFYGPGTGFDDDWFERAKAGNWVTMSHGDCGLNDRWLLERRG
jgi:hypothetical protein